MIAGFVELARAHAPLLVIEALLVGAALAAASPSARMSWAIATLAAMAAAALGADLAWRVLVLDAQPASVTEGLSIAADGVGVFAVALVTVTVAAALLGSIALLDDFEPRAAPFALALVLAGAAGWCGAALARDFTTLFLSVEIAWLAGVGLAALASHGDAGALNGAVRMLTSGGIAAVFLLLGVGLVERSIGAGDLTAMTTQRMAVPGLGAVGVVLTIMALALKAGAAPFNSWMAAVAARAGALATMSVGVVGVAGAALVLTRLAALAVLAPAVSGGVALVLTCLGVAAVVAGSAQAIGAVNVRRLVAYAGCAQLGCAMFGMALGSPAGFEAALLQVMALAGSQLAVIAGAASAGGDGSLRSLNGLGRRAPLSAAAVTAGALSYMGAPLTLTFLGRWRLIEAALGVGWWWAAAAAIAASLAGVFYGGRLIERIYFRHATSSTLSPTKRGLSGYLIAPVLCASIAVVALGLEPTFVWRAAAHASALMLEREP